MSSSTKPKKGTPCSTKGLGSILGWVKERSNHILQPVTRSSVLYHYLPMGSAVSYNVLALSILNPKLVTNLNKSLGIARDMTNVYVGTSIVGFSLFFYSRKRFLDNFSIKERLGYSCYFASISVLGSVLAWAIAAKVVPWKNPLFRTILAFLSASGMLKAKKFFIEALESTKK